jgi:uncharacterized phosphosugar-binding protein
VSWPTRPAGTLVFRTIERGGLVHTFGTGHSHLLAEEIFSRAGGLLPINVIRTAPLMLHEDAVASGDWERLPGAAPVVLEHAGIDPARDILIVISNSGRNAVPVEAAEWARAGSIPVVAVTALAHSRSQSPLAPSGKKLYGVADVVLANAGQPGDSAVEIRPGLRVAATSSIVGAFLLQSVVLSAVEQCVAAGIEPPVLMSGNVAGAREANARLVGAYPGRLADAYQRRRRSQAADSASCSRSQREDA